MCSLYRQKEAEKAELCVSLEGADFGMHNLLFGILATLLSKHDNSHAKAKFSNKR